MDQNELTDGTSVERLYRAVLDAWNRRSASDFAALFAATGSMVGFDGSQVTGADGIAAHLVPIFRDHPTPAYVGDVEEVRLLAAGVAIVRAVSGLVPAGQEDIVPALNAIQTLVATRHGDSWHVDLFQNTPAQFHGHPELAEQLTTKLREALRKSKAGS
ncbi:MAG: SgcJ/EcaC family oxidoreductase [Anaerolineaceae bacterium]